MLVLVYGSGLISTPTLVATQQGSRFLVCQTLPSPLLLSSARFSILSRFSLLMFSFFETLSLPNGCAGCVISSQLLLINSLGDSVSLFGSRVASSESVWPAMRWQERECADMLGVFFTSKRDRRSLFLPALLGLAPLKKATPTSGFFEISSSPVIGLSLRRLGSS